MDIKVSPKRIANVLIGEDSYKLRVPSVLEAEKHFKQIQENESYGKIVDMLDDLGLPREVSEGLDILQLSEILEGLTSLSKKN
jgi:hypothetical protein